jgi:hypothetical protein
LRIFEYSQPQKLKRNILLQIPYFQEKIAAFFKKKPLGENFGDSFSFGANNFCQFFTVWTIVYKKKYPQLILN